MRSIQNINGVHPAADLVDDFLDHMERARIRSEHISGLPGALAGTMTIEALPTYYRGTTFRSALEASWAATLDSLDIAWEYEPETVTLPSGAVYIPDFRLPDHNTWLEVKGTGVPRIEKTIEFATTCTCLVLIGHPPQPYDVRRDSRYDDLDYPPRQRRRKTVPVWSAAHTQGGSPWLTRCPDCNRGGWFTRARCRACDGPLIGAHAYQSGAAEIEFMTVSGPAAAATDPITETGAAP